MKRPLLFIIPFFLFGCASVPAYKHVNIIPRPLDIEYHKGFKKVDSSELFSKTKKSIVSYELSNEFSDLGDEGYILDVTSKDISIKAKTKIGLFYGDITLRQLYTSKGLPKVKIKDKPRFPYRGILLDVSRHFFSKEEIKELIDLMSYYKLNTLQWHLTDDGGWRIEIDAYPKLTQLGSHRTDKIWQNWWKNGGKFTEMSASNAHGGYYSKNDVKEIISYASSKAINIVPEIEFPGHSRAVFAAYPELCCSGIPYTNNAFCPGNESTYIFMDKVLNEVMDLFPSKIIHIGGDETNMTAWKSCPKCQSLMKIENMKEFHELHNYIVKRAETVLNNRGRRLAGWDEIIDKKLNKTSIITSWQGDEFGTRAMEQGYDVIFAPLHYLYLDYFQSSPNTQPLAHDGYTTLKKVYSYNPPVKDDDSHALGIQAQLWTEWISDMPQLEYMAFPRTLAVSEVGWSVKQNRDWTDFNRRLPYQLKYLKNRGINTYNPTGNIDFDIRTDSLNKNAVVSLENEEESLAIKYTTDGSMPNKKSKNYEKPFIITDSLNLTAASFKNDSTIGEVFKQNFYYHNAIGKNIKSSLNSNNLNLLIDGQLGGKTYLDEKWLNFSGDQEFLIDLKNTFTIHMISSRWMQLYAGARRSFPDKIEIYYSLDGKKFELADSIVNKNSDDINNSILKINSYSAKGSWNARFILLKVFSKRGGMSLDEICIF
ncbi:beta-N-acetylhexosaminidase [Sphingobacterium sp. ML3W]|uniref:beta-N-acetylhexosaminidase n=1 Tax=Sphingobacterium sp. ML3W TaxID=1538644 RepID=UPI00068EB405|nr:family 20 glycosylhydrolase [Sphingobacterium sp. ML3W]